MRNRESSQLILAYDATLEVLATALELRDQEANGHTQRGTEDNRPKFCLNSSL